MFSFKAFRNAARSRSPNRPMVSLPENRFRERPRRSLEFEPGVQRMTKRWLLFSDFRLRICHTRPATPFFSCFMAAMLGGCAVGPDYQRPVVHIPGTYRRAASDTNAP